MIKLLRDTEIFFFGCGIGGGGVDVLRQSSGANPLNELRGANIRSNLFLVVTTTKKEKKLWRVRVQSSFAT